MFALIDCNNFYASCERVFRPDLIGKPIAVLSNNDGCVIARSNEVKSLGLPMGAPAFQYQDFFDTHHVHVFSANFALYGDLSMRVMTILSSYCPEIEIYSIDEAFLNFSGFEHFDLQKYGEEIACHVKKSTGIPISIGFAETKTLAKAANRIAKKYPDKTQNVYMLDSEPKRIKALKWLQVEDVWGIGRQHSKRLKAQGVQTAYDFSLLPPEKVKKQMGIVGVRMQQELQGLPTLSMEKHKPKKNIATTRSFEKMYTTLSELKERVATFSVTCAEKLRKQKSCCRSLMVFVHTNGFRKDLPQYSRNIVVKLPFATNSSIEIAQYAQKGLEQIFCEGYSYKKAGVVIMDFYPKNSIQQTLFDVPNPKHNAIMKAMDMLNHKIGATKIKLATQDRDRVWKMRQEKLSPRYTTKIQDIITINAT
jgi:DNA polymerase V